MNEKIACDPHMLVLRTCGLNGQERTQSTGWGKPPHTDRLKSSGSYFLLSTPLAAAFVNQLRAALIDMVTLLLVPILKSVSLMDV